MIPAHGHGKSDRYKFSFPSGLISRAAFPTIHLLELDFVDVN